MATARAQAALKSRLESVATRFSTATFQGHLAEDIDFVSDAGVIRGKGNVAQSLADATKLRGESHTVAVSWLDKNLALVDSLAEKDGKKTWFTEIWQSDGRDALSLVSIRVRADSPAKHLQSMSTSRQSFVDSNNSRAADEAALRSQFKAFRTAFNASDTKKVLALFTPKCDAIPVFSFLKGRAQILQGRLAIGDKSDRMGPGAEVINPDPNRRGALVVDGEPKTIRFMSDTVAVVDGTAKIGNIPKGHGFAPAEMSGIYTDVWVKTRNNWQIQGSRAWF